MSRLRFPEDRTSFIHQGPNRPILTPPRTAIQLFTDEHGPELADVTDLVGHPMPDSMLYTAEDGLVPEFYGPSGAARVWARVVGPESPRYPLTAQYSELLTSRPGLETSVGQPDTAQGSVGSWCIDRTNYVIYGPKTAGGWPPGVPLRHDGLTKPTGYTHNQVSASDEWDMPHPLDFEPNVSILNTFGEEVEGDLTYSLNRVVARFSAPFSGRAIMS